MTENEDLALQSVRAFIDATAAKTSTPGGGSVAGVAGALGTALGEMSLAFTRGKKNFAQHEEDYRRIAARLLKARSMFLQLLADDVAAYQLYQQALACDGPEKADRTALAVAAAVNVPREMTKLALAVLDDLASLVDRCNRWLITDLAAGAVLVEAVVRLSHLNVLVNLAGCPDARTAEEVRQSSAADWRRARAAAADLERAVQEKLTP